MIDPKDQSPLSQCDDQLLADLVEEISQQLEAGGSIDLDSYYLQYPSYADQFGNLLLDAAGHVWVADFGLARVEDESQLTRTGDVLGTLAT